MDAVAITVGLSMTLTGLLVICLAIPLIHQRVGRNGLYGMRFPESFKSDEAWFAVNHYGGKRLIVWAIPLVLIGIACFFLPMQSHPGLSIAVGLAPVVFVLVPTFEGWQFARRYPPGK